MSFSLWRKGTVSSAVLQARLQQSHRVRATVQGDTTVLLDMQRERYYTLNEVGGLVWTLLAEGTTRTEIIGAIRRDYDVQSLRDGDSMEGDVDRLLTTLHAAGLITVARGGAPSLT
jgi:hypothetical protein